MRLDLPSPPIEFDFFGNKSHPDRPAPHRRQDGFHGREVQLYNTHLLAFSMLAGGKTESPWQRNLVADQIAEATGPTILTGDFNEHRHDILIKHFGECGFHTAQQTEITCAAGRSCSITFSTTRRCVWWTVRCSRLLPATITPWSPTSNFRPDE